MKLYYPTQPKNAYRIDAYFLDVDYYRYYNMWHTGIDLNAKTGGNTDLGAPVYAVYDGEITEARMGGSTWGNIVRIWHPGLNVYTRYAHLDKIMCVPGPIKRGDLIGTIGKGKNNMFTSHLHFDVMKNLDSKSFDYGVDKPGLAARAEVKKYFIDPIALFNKFGVE